MSNTPSAAAGVSSARYPYLALGIAGMLASATSEIPNALLPALMLTVLGGAPVVLGLIEGAAALAAGAARSAAASAAEKRVHDHARTTASVAVAALLSSLLGAVTSAWQVGLLRAGSSGLDDLRDPAHESLVHDVTPTATHRDVRRRIRYAAQSGKVLGPLLALALFALFNARGAMLFAVVPGAAAVIILVAVQRRLPPAVEAPTDAGKLGMRALFRGELRGLAVAVMAFEFGNVAVALLVLRSINLLSPGMGLPHAVMICIGLYAIYNGVALVAATQARHHDSHVRSAVELAAGTFLFLVAYFAFALTGPALGVIAFAFVASGAGLGLVRTAERRLVERHLAPSDHAAAFSLLSQAQTLGNASASALTGILWSAVSVRAALLYLGAWLTVSCFGTLAALRQRPTPPSSL